MSALAGRTVWLVAVVCGGELVAPMQYDPGRWYDSRHLARQAAKASNEKSPRWMRYFVRKAVLS